MLVKMIFADSLRHLEIEINDFIKGRDVYYIIPDFRFLTAMVVYEKKSRKKKTA